MTQDRLISPAEVAQLFGVSPITVRSWVTKGLLKAKTTPGGHRRFAQKDVEDLIQHHGSQSAEKILRILVVDDDRQFREFLVEFFSTITPKVNVAQATDGFHAGLMTAQFKPHIILLDYSMPGLSGVTVCKQIKSNLEHAAIRIIAVTGHGLTSVKQELLDAGAEAVLTKPVSTTLLVDHVLGTKTV
jgi:excisionase family DNA binding protein